MARSPASRRGDVSWWDRLGPRTALQAVFLTATVTVLIRHGRAVARTPARAKPASPTR
ncbi:hypothetical protein [Streptomyces sp. NPDC051577]|uniref:hypothetical protein n=1 Tax=Streptomyces sp. NPDC051577 TaxID=3155166 RepID=UPI00342C1D03